MSDPAIDVKDLAVSLSGRPVLSDISFSADARAFIAIVGPNGAGKTTLLRAIAGLVPATGEIAISGEPLSSLSLPARARQIAYLPQGHVFHWPLSVIDVVGLGRLPRGAGADLSEADRAAVATAMAETGTSRFAGRPVTTLSGGERARVAMARVLATEAPIVLADEPTASLDPRYQLAVIGMLRRHTEASGIVVAVLHDLGLAARSADRVIVIDGGRIVSDGPPAEVLTAARLAETFGVDSEVVTVRGAPVIVPWSLSERR